MFQSYVVSRKPTSIYPHYTECQRSSFSPPPSPPPFSSATVTNKQKRFKVSQTVHSSTANVVTFRQAVRIRPRQVTGTGHHEDTGTPRDTQRSLPPRGQSRVSDRCV